MTIWYFVYVLISEIDKKFYIGSTTRLVKRVNEHNRGKNTSTNKRKPLFLHYFEAHLSKTDALRRERYFKTAKGKTTIRQITRGSLIKK